MIPERSTLDLDRREELLRHGEVIPVDTSIVELLAYGFSRSSAIEVRAFALFLQQLAAAKAERRPLPGDDPAMLWATDQLTSFELVVTLVPDEITVRRSVA